MDDERPMLEREQEIAALRAAVASASGGSGCAVLLDGEAGIGKSTLLDALADAGRSAGATVLRARGVVVEASYGFGGLHQLLTSELRRRRPARVDPDWGPAAVVLRILRLAEGEVPPDEFAVQHGVYWTVDLLAAQSPLVLCVDDAQWLDAPSMAALLFLARRVADLPVVIGFGVRAGEPDPSGLLAQLGDVPGIVRLAPRPLTRAAAVTLLGRRGRDDEELADACLAATGGNPFLLGEVVEALPADADPASVADLTPTEVIRGVTGRLRVLEAEATKVARAIAVLDADASLRCVADVAAIGVDEVRAAVDDLTTARLVTVDANGPAFRHPLLRSAVYRAMPPGLRSAAHRAAAASLLADRFAADRGVAHLLEVVPAADRWVEAQLRAGAARAVAAGAPADAVALLHRAAAEGCVPLDPALWRELGHAQMVAGDAEAVDSLTRALDGDLPTELRIEAATDLCQVLSAADRLEDAVGVLDTEIARLDAAAPERAVQLRSLAVIGLEEPATASWTLRTVARAVDVGIEADRFGRRVILTQGYARALVGDGPASDVAAAVEPALPPAWWREHSGSGMTALYGGVATLLWTGQVERASSAAAAILRDAERSGDLLKIGAICYWLSHLALLRGEVPEAVDLGRRALEHHGPSPFLHRLTLAGLLQALVVRGEIEECDRLLAAEGQAGPMRSSLSGACLAYARIPVHLARGRHDEAMADVALLGAFTSERGGSVPGWGRPVLDALRAVGADEVAHVAAQQNLERARRWGERGAIGVATCDLGRLEPGDRGIARLAEGIELLAASPLRLEHVSALTAYGAALRRNRQVAAARAALERAVDLAHRCGALAIRDEALEELRLTGARPRRLAATGVDALTPGEFRVARKAAEGLSNAEVCQALFLTRSTVEKHLTAAYGKLGISSRDQLAAALAGQADDAVTDASRS